MDQELRKRLETFLMPLYQDLDGISRFDDVERIARIARQLHPPESLALDLLLLFHRLGNWLDRVGNISRVVLAVGGVSESDLRRTAMSIKHLEAPGTGEERAVAAAILIDREGVRGLAARFATARREGHSVLDVVREAVASSWVPDWVPSEGREWLERRHESRRAFCSVILDELDLKL
ncbi:MAG: hypothetical protein JJE51_09185 [Thermoanaerobaculia bacterium]|nr:hypothetical protein [Thermoanaerobaculia bacterium]